MIAKIKSIEDIIEQAEICKSDVRRDITRLTERLGDAICAAHGWDAVKYGMGKSKMVKKNAPAQNPETEKEIRMA